MLHITLTESKEADKVFRFSSLGVFYTTLRTQTRQPGTLTVLHWPDTGQVCNYSHILTIFQLIGLSVCAIFLIAYLRG